MIKFEHTEVMNFEAALRGMRNPLNSWEKSDSQICDDLYADCKGGWGCKYYGDNSDGCYCIGNEDMKLAQKLINAGSDHRKFLRQIFVSVDITAPLYWWKEFDTYKVGTVANSCSTMHTIHKKKLTLDDFSHELLITDWNGQNVEAMIWDGYELPNRPIDVMQYLIDALNVYREAFITTKDRRFWDQMIQLLPTSFNQKRTVTLNYENLRNIYASRRGHKLAEWRVGFIDWIKTLPYADELIIS